MTLVERTQRDEGKVLDAQGRHKPYQDPLGIWTIGYGHNCQTKSIRQEAADLILKHDLEDAEQDLVRALPWTAKLDDARRAVLVDMSFNMGLRGLLSFKQTLPLIESGQYAMAANAILASKYAKQVGARAVRNARQLETGEWQ